MNKPIRLIELFAGIGSQAKALTNLNIDFEHHAVIELDKFAIKSYNAIHSTDFKPTDITQISATDLNIVNTNNYNYIMTYSFPCQDLSFAGKRLGMSKDGDTRSSLLWQVRRLLQESSELPQVLLMENVSAVHDKKNLPHFEDWINFLEKLGYKNFYKDLYANDYGIPQKRKRCFMLSFLDVSNYKFPISIPLETTLKDFLENDVDSKYFLSQIQIEKIINNSYETNRRRIQKANGLCSTIYTSNTTPTILKFRRLKNHESRKISNRKISRNY